MNKEHVFKNLCNIADNLILFFGRECEIAIHDLSRPESSLVYLAGNVTHRKVGAPATDFLIKQLAHYGNNVPDIAPYSATGRQGERLRGALFYIRDDDGTPLFAICLNQNISKYLTGIALLEELVRTTQPEGEKPDAKHETYAETTSDTMDAIVRQVLQKFGKLPAELDRKEKIQLVAEFEQHGAFRLKGMVEHIASIMGISKYTLYSYRKAGSEQID